MIISTYTNNFPMPLNGMANFKDTSVVQAIGDAPISDICYCGCDYVELAFVKSTGEYWKNDKKSVLVSKIDSSDTIDITLLKDGVQVAVLNDSTYGDFYDYGTLIAPLYKGIIVDWYKVKAALGYGSYQIKVSHTNYGKTVDSLTHKINVVEWNTDRAKNTVRIETYQNGDLLNGFNYSGINWYQSIRIEGKFGNKKPEIITDRYQTSQREIKTIQDKVTNTYVLNTQLLPSEIFNALNYNYLLADIILITDYNVNQELYRRKSVIFENFETVNNHNRSIKSNFTYTFKDNVDDIIKRTYNDDYGIIPMQPNTITPLVCLDSTLNINGGLFDTIASGGTLNLLVKDTLGSQVGSKVGSDWIVPAGPTPSGIVYCFPVPTHRTSYDTNGYDSGGRIQSGFYSYTPPANPVSLAMLDMSLTDYFFRLKNNNIFGNKYRFTDIDGGQTFSATNNKNAVLIDHLTGYLILRRVGVGSLGAGSSWQNQINNADSLSFTVAGTTYTNWRLFSILELKLLFGDNPCGNAVVDGAVTIIGSGGATLASSDTLPGFSTYTYYIDVNGEQRYYLKSGSYGGTQIAFKKFLW